MAAKKKNPMEQLVQVDPQGAWLTTDAPQEAIPENAMDPTAAMRLVTEELAVEGIPERNLATFVTTWMEPEARQVIDENLYRNFIDHAEYPMTAEIEQRCIKMLAKLFNAPGETTGARTQGSSEAIMLGALSLKWKWRKRREAARKPTDGPNLVFGGDVHVVWEKFCRYFDVEPRIVPLQPGKYTIGQEDVEPHEHHRRGGRGRNHLHGSCRRCRRYQRAGSSRFARSTRRGTSSAWSIRGSAG